MNCCSVSDCETGIGAPPVLTQGSAMPQADASAQQAKTPVRNGVSRAVVIGGSVAGIFAAAVAAPYFDEVCLACHACVLCNQA